MQGRNYYLNIPIEIIRTIVAISESGSLSKAAANLGLSQPALSSHVKRAESLLRGEIFSKTANGTVLTELGKLVLTQARRMLEANDQILRIGGATDGPQPLRVGISTPFVREFFAGRSSKSMKEIVVTADSSASISRSLVDGHLDIACFYEDPETTALLSDFVIVREREEQFVWVRSKDFVLSPGAAVPILHSPKFDYLVRVLTMKNVSFRVVFSTPDYEARVAAAHFGVGLTALPLRLVPPSLVLVKDYYLPELPPIRILLCARQNLNNPAASAVLDELSLKYFEPLPSGQHKASRP